MANFGFEISLLSCLLLNGAVFGSALFVAFRRLTHSRSQAALDGVLFGYLIQYVSVGLAGLWGWLNFPAVASIAGGISILLFTAAWQAQPIARAKLPRWECIFAISTGLFLLGFVGAFVYQQADSPVISNDALTYHFPAAVQWIQTGRIDRFETWFFNPANAFSPLAGSIFIAWLMLPFGNDLAARFVEVPALLCVAIAMFRLFRVLGCRVSVALLMATATALCRPIFTACLMGKDDLFVVFFFIAAVVALSPDRSGKKIAPVRLGITLGLLLATKYTVLLAIPMLLVGINGPCWRARGWAVLLGSAGLLAGPWYWWNWRQTGNPLFPVVIPHLFRGLFTTAVSGELRSWDGCFSVIFHHQYGMPWLIMGILLVGWIVAFIWRSSTVAFAKPQAAVLRICLIGPVLGMAIFLWKSPFPEVRFLMPVFVLLFAAAGQAIASLTRNEKVQIAVAGTVVALSLLVLLPSEANVALITFTVIGLMLAMAGMALAIWARSSTLRWASIAAALLLSGGIFTYVHWTAYCTDYLTHEYVDNATYKTLYPQSAPLWSWVNENLPADAHLAYTNMYLLHPLQGARQERLVGFVSTRAWLGWIGDLPYLGDRLTGEQIVARAARAADLPGDEKDWLARLQWYDYLIIGRGGVIGEASESAMARSDTAHFKVLFSTAGGDVYAVKQQPLVR